MLLLGSGLTAVDALLALRHHWHCGKVYMVSRWGLLPQTHVLPVDSIRPETNRDRQALSFAEQRRFLRHLRPLWDTHSHRMAPQIGTVVHGSLRDGSLEVLAGRTYGLRLVQDGVEVSIAIRGCTEIKTLKVERVVNCTGPDTDLSRSTNPVLRNLVEQGWLQPDAHRLGALVDDRGALSPARGGRRPPLYALGRCRWGRSWNLSPFPRFACKPRSSRISRCRRAGNSRRTGQEACPT